MRSSLVARNLDCNMRDLHHIVKHQHSFSPPGQLSHEVLLLGFVRFEGCTYMIVSFNFRDESLHSALGRK